MPFKGEKNLLKVAARLKKLVYSKIKNETTFLVSV